MNDALQLILNGLVQAIVQHPSFQEILAKHAPSSGTHDEELATLRTLYHNAEEDRRDMLRRIDALEVREDGSTYRQLERRIDALEDFDIENALESATIHADNVTGLDGAIAEAVAVMRATITFTPRDEE